ncbi:MAG: isoamylase early set domain-containing protein [Bacteroidota bacterium]
MVQKTYYKTKNYCKVKFSFKVENTDTSTLRQALSSVEILGLNSNWQNSIIMSKKKDGSFSADVNLPKESRHEFKYLVNETLWLNEPEADAEQPNEYGSSNSVIVL